jgi:hypothetical protein
MSFFGTLKQ